MSGAGLSLERVFPLSTCGVLHTALGENPLLALCLFCAGEFGKEGARTNGPLPRGFLKGLLSTCLLANLDVFKGDWTLHTGPRYFDAYYSQEKFA